MKSSNYFKNLIFLILSMSVFGTVGVFSRLVPYSSGTVVLVRSVIGFIFVSVFMLICKKKPVASQIKANLIPLLLSGVCLGANWILFFEACKITTVATATLSYYLAPMIMVAASPLLFREKLTLKKIACILTAALGMFFVSGVIGQGVSVNPQGIALGVGAAVLYAAVVCLNKIMSRIDVYTKTALQFFVSSVLLLPYVLLIERPDMPRPEISHVLILLLIGILHTGAAYLMYFRAATELPANTTAIYSYIDPIIAVVLSSLVLREPLQIFTVIGAVLILGSSLVGEINLKFRKKEQINEDNNENR